MDRIKEITVTSRRSHPIKNDFFTFEMGVTADVSGLNDKDKKAYVEKMWDYANNEVDQQILDVQESLDKNK